MLKEISQSNTLVGISSLSRYAAWLQPRKATLVPATILFYYSHYSDFLVFPIPELHVTGIIQYALR